MKKTIKTCAGCTPIKAFHLFYATSKAACEMCGKQTALAAIPKRYFSKKKQLTASTNEH